MWTVTAATKNLYKEKEQVLEVISRVDYLIYHKQSASFRRLKELHMAGVTEISEIRRLTSAQSIFKNDL